MAEVCKRPPGESWKYLPEENHYLNRREMNSMDAGHERPPVVGGLGDASNRTQLREFPPSVKLVALILHQADGPLTKQELGDRTLLADRTLRYALNRLETAELVRSRPLPSDTRKRLFWLRDEP